MTLGEALQCPEEEAEARWQLRAALEFWGSFWAKDFELAAASYDDQAASCSLSDQPRFAFLRGQSSVLRHLSKELRNMPASNDALRKLMTENQGE